jgi:hypothetical protein
MKPLTTKGKDLVSFLTLIGLLAVSGWIATWGFQSSQTFVDVSDNPTPLGYTKSLVLFLFPCAVFGVWLVKFLKSPTRQKAFWLTILLLAPIGIALDLFFGLQFLTFENPGSVLGSQWPWAILPAYDIREGVWRKYIPIEEVLFYLLGFVTILLSYVWCDHVVFGESKVSLAQTTPRVFRNWKRTFLFWIAVGLGLFGIAYAIRASVPPEGERAFPGYFLFLLVTAVLPSMICSRLAFHFVNFRALTLAWLFVLGISQFWEAALGIPYRWWGYQKDQMMGFFIKAQCDLPVEAILVWTLATWATVMVYETILSVLRIKEQKPGRTVLEALQGDEKDVPRLKAYYGRGR